MILLEKSKRLRLTVFCGRPKSLMITRRASMKRKCLKCEYCYLADGVPESCCYGVSDGAYPIGEFCPKDGKRIREFKDKE